MICCTLQVARTSKAWIITTGYDKGMAKAVGDAIEEGQSYSWGDKNLKHNIHCIGISHWGRIERRENLIGKDGRVRA